MTYPKKIFVFLCLSVLALSGCSEWKSEESVAVGAEYPAEMFPVYSGAQVYEYSFNEGIIDISFGTDDDYEKVSRYYDTLFEHSKYDVTANKLTTQSYISSGKTNHYKYLLEVKKAIFRQEKKKYNTIVSLRISINGFTSDSEINGDATPTPQAVLKTTPPPTGTPVVTDTPAPTAEPETFLDMEAISTVDMADEQIFIECLSLEESLREDGQKDILVLLKIVNYGEQETGYISVSDFVLIDSNGEAHYSAMNDGIFAAGVNVLPGGYCADYIRFTTDETTQAAVLAMPEGLGSRTGSSYDFDIAPVRFSDNSGAYDSMISEPADISGIPTYIIGQEYTLDDALKLKLSSAQYFDNHTTINQENLMYTFSMEFTNISDGVIIPAEIRSFALYDLEHNIIIKPTLELTPYDELGFSPVQAGTAENYHLSFEIFEKSGENYLCLLLTSANPQDSPIIYKIR